MYVVWILLKGISVGLCDGILRQKDNHGVRGATTVVGRKSVVESQGALRSQHLGYAIHNALVGHFPSHRIRPLGHESTLDQIERHGKESGREPGAQRRQDARRQFRSIRHGVAQHAGVKFLELIVTGHHTCVVEWLF